MTVTRPPSLAGHSLVVAVVVGVVLTVVLTVGGVTLGDDSEEALEVSFQPHGLDVAFKEDDDAIGGKEVPTPGLEAELELLSSILELPLIGVDVGNTSVGLTIVVMVPRFNGSKKESGVAGVEQSPDDAVTTDTSSSEVVIAVFETVSIGL